MVVPGTPIKILNCIPSILKNHETAHVPIHEIKYVNKDTQIMETIGIEKEKQRLFLDRCQLTVNYLVDKLTNVIRIRGYRYLKQFRIQCIH